MNRGIYLRADGRLPCYCGSGETVTLGAIRSNGYPVNFLDDYYLSGAFAHIRRQMARDMVPWPGICDQCTYLDLDADFETGLIEKEVEWFHWEPSYLCMLDCEWCHGQRNGGRSSQNSLLDGALFEGLVDSLYRAGMTLKMGNICGVGEPTTNPRLWDQIKFVKDRLGGDILVSTNGNGPYSDKIVSSGLTKIKIAVDAVDQEAYQRYRKNGSLEHALKFTRKITEAKDRMGSDFPIIIWQYILFNHNDSDEQLLRWQKMALEHGVNRLRFVFTRCNNYSLRTPEDIPKIFPDIDFLPISRYSQISIEEIENEWKNIVTLTGEQDSAQAAKHTIRLLNRIYHRLALGVKTYKDLLSFTKGLTQLHAGNLLDIPSEEFAQYVSFILKCLIKLEELYNHLGQNSQAEGYRRYRLALGLN